MDTRAALGFCLELNVDYIVASFSNIIFQHTLMGFVLAATACHVLLVIIISSLAASLFASSRPMYL